MSFHVAVTRKASYIIVAIALFYVVVNILSAFSLIRSQDREVFASHSFGVGFDLTPSYGTVAVSYPNGSTISIAKIEGNEIYRSMMLRLSLKSSEHLHEPYSDVGEAIRDMPRKLKRNARKNMGLPASTDVGTLSEMIKTLHSEAEAFVGQPITMATISIPQVTALYGEDLYEAFEYLQLYYIKFVPFTAYYSIPSTVAVWVGNGRGLCANYTVPDLCREQREQLPSAYILAVSYTHTSLIASQVGVQSAYYLREAPKIADLTLGYDARYDNPNEDFYWEKVRDTLSFPIVSSYDRRNITKVLVSGDASRNAKFRSILKEVTDAVLEEVPEVIDDYSVYSAARGVAELAKRAIYAQNRTSSGFEVELKL